MTSASGGQRSIQLSYGRMGCTIYAILPLNATGIHRIKNAIFCESRAKTGVFLRRSVEKLTSSEKRTGLASPRQLTS